MNIWRDYFQNLFGSTKLWVQLSFVEFNEIKLLFWYYLKSSLFSIATVFDKVSSSFVSI